MRQDKFSELIGFPVGTRKLFERAAVHNKEIGENEDSFFFYTRKKKESKFEHSESTVLKCFLDFNLIVKLKNKTYKNGKPIYALVVPKLEACKIVSKELGVNSGTFVTHHFPSNIRKSVTCTEHCKDCAQRGKVIASLNRTFNRNFCVETPFNNYVQDNKIKNITIVDPNSGVRTRLNRAQQKEYKERQEVLKCLDEHFFDKTKSSELWREMFVRNKIKRDTVVIIIDGMSSLKVGSGEGIRGLKGPRCHVIPIGFIFLYSCPETGKTKRISRVCIPDSNIHNTWQYTECMKKLFQKNDPELLQLFRTRNKVIVIILLLNISDIKNNIEDYFVL